MPPKSQSEVVDIEVEVKIEREKAWLVVSSITGKEAWIPKSVGEIEHDGGGLVGLTIPRWMAEKKGLV